MNLTFFDKLAVIFKYTFSSFLSIELLIFSILLFVILIINMKRKEKIVTFSAIGIYLGLLIGTMIAYNEYVFACIKQFFKSIIEFVCFPSTVAFFFTMGIITIIMVYTLFSKKLSNLKKVINYLIFSIIYFLFMSFIAVTAYSDINLESNIALYTNDYVIAIVQASNLLLVIWCVFTLFYRLYLYFKKKYD